MITHCTHGTLAIVAPIVEMYTLNWLFKYGTETDLCSHGENRHILIAAEFIFMNVAQHC